MSTDSFNDSFHPYPSSANFSINFLMKCYFFKTSVFIRISFSVTTIVLLLPLCITVLYYGHQEWRKKRSTSSATTIYHSDCFTYHMVIIELIGVIGYLLVFGSYYLNDPEMLLTAFLPTTFTYFGEIFLQCLTCVEHYLAVIHPVTYRSLRNTRGIRMRNISIGCVWLFSLVGMISVLSDISTAICVCFIMILALTVVSFCSLTVLRGLIRPGPGDQGGGKGRVDQTKLKAFYIIVVFLVVLLLKLVWGFCWSVLKLLGNTQDCVTMTCGLWLKLPSNLVLPVLFLQRRGKFVCCNTTSLNKKSFQTQDMNTSAEDVRIK